MQKHENTLEFHSRLIEAAEVDVTGLVTYFTIAKAIMLKQ
jgi:hypothetical protein